MKARFNTLFRLNEWRKCVHFKDLLIGVISHLLSGDAIFAVKTDDTDGSYGQAD